MPYDSDVPIYFPFQLCCRLYDSKNRHLEFENQARSTINEKINHRSPAQYAVWLKYLA